MILNCATQTTGALVLAAIAAVYGQTALGAESDTNAAPTNASAPAIKAPAEQSAKAPVRFEGTDLRIGSLPPITFHGFGSQGFLYSSDYNYLGESTDGSGQFTELGLNASVSPFKRTRIAVQGFTFDVGEVGNFAMLLDYASIEYTVNNYIGLRGGRIRRPGGIYNHIQDVDLARTWVLLPQGVYDARWRDFSSSIDGGSIFGNIGLGKGGSFSYELYGGYASLSDEGGVARAFMNGQPANISLASMDSTLFLGGQLWWYTPLTGLRAGLGGGQASDLGVNFEVATPFGNGTSRTVGDFPFYQLSVEYAWKSWTFQAEYYTYDGALDVTTKLPLPPPNDLSERASHTTPDAWYLSASRRINKWLEMGAYYTEYYTDKNDRSGSSDASQKDVALSARFDIKDWWIVKLEGHYIHGTGLLQDNALNPVRNDDGWWMLAVKTTFSF